jgi:hypothetical protein
VSHLSCYNVQKLDVRTAGWGISNNDELPVILETVDLKIMFSKTFEKKLSKFYKKSYYTDERFLHSYANPYGLLHFVSMTNT